MRQNLLLFLLFLLPMIGFCQTDTISTIGMTNAKIQEILAQEVDKFEGQLGGWTFDYYDRPIVIITDENANRIRIFSPVVEETDLEKGQLKKMLQANFHSALDAKYSIYEGFVVSIFTHPLKELTPDQFINALRQVVVLNHTFGSTYQSTDMVFPGGVIKDEAPNLNKKPIKRS